MELSKKAFQIVLESKGGLRFPAAAHLLALLPDMLDPRVLYGRVWSHLRIEESKLSIPDSGGGR